MKVRNVALLLAAVAAAACSQSPAIGAGASKWIAAGNRAWSRGMETGNATLIASSYTRDGLDCGPDGTCRRGRAAILRATRARLAQLGHAQSATVVSRGAVRRGVFVYEWGEASATFAGGRSIRGQYLTVWTRRPDGSWKIYRNLALPPAPPPIH